MIHLPVTRQGARYILKLDPPEFPHLVANEAFFLRAARLSGLDVAEAEVVRDRDGAVGLLVQRFDRGLGPSGDRSALAQEDGCQVLGIYPADKYRIPSEELVTGLAGVCRARPVAALELIRQMAFAYLTCNGDAHAKNFSVSRVTPSEWRVAPAYDIPSSHPYGDTTLALSIHGRRRKDVGRRDFIALGQTAGVPPRSTERVLDELCGGSELWLADLEGLPFDGGVSHKLRRAIGYRRARLEGGQ